MAKKWNFKSWVKKLKELKRRKKEEDVPFYLPSDDLKQDNASKSKGVLDFFQGVFAVKNRHKVHSVFVGIMIVVISWFTGKLTALFLIPYDLKSTPGEVPTVIANTTDPAEWQRKTRLIWDNDLFQTAKPNKGPSKKKGQEKKNCFMADNKSSLPIQLESTTVLQDSVKSLAAVQLRNSKDLKEIREGEKIDDMAEIYRIERLRINFKNLRTGECEYISHKKLEEDDRIKAPTVLGEAASKKVAEELKQVEGIKQTGNKVCISRTLINEKMQNLNQILRDARALQINNPDGSISYKIVEITPGSIYSHLNIQNNDIIKSVNGKTISSLNDVMNLFGKIATLSKLNMEIERDGNVVPMKYEFTKNNPTECKDAQ